MGREQEKLYDCKYSLRFREILRVKKVEIKIGGFLGEIISKPIRDKRDIILILLETLKSFTNQRTSISNEIGKVTIRIDKMSRIFYETKEKYFSFIFPFSLDRQEEQYKFYDNLTDCELNDRLISLLISIFKQDGVLEDSLEKAMDFIVESAEEYDYKDIDSIWRLIFKLWYMEDGYIRYDYDPIHENGDIHPLYHFDINYSTGVTYKVGLKFPIQMNEFQDILDIKTGCAYLESI